MYFPEGNICVTWKKKMLHRVHIHSHKITNANNSKSAQSTVEYEYVSWKWDISKDYCRFFSGMTAGLTLNSFKATRCVRYAQRACACVSSFRFSSCVLLVSLIFHKQKHEMRRRVIEM